MNIFNDPILSITAADINQLCDDQIEEGIRLELKSDLPSRKGLDAWHDGGGIGEYALGIEGTGFS
jgi:hypothetical protein